MDKTNQELISSEALVIGFDQCATSKGRILAILTPADTVITYNFPDSIYGFPNELFDNYQYDCFFPATVLENYPVHVTYTSATSEELSAYICLGSIYTSKLSPLVKNKQVVIISATK
jgi:hypothetical protein